MKKCSTGGWDKEAKKATGCDYIEWINGTTEPLDEDCPECGKKLALYTTANGKKMKKCSTSGWDKVTRMVTGCPYIYWLKPNEYFFEPESQNRRPQQTTNDGEEFLPPEPEK